MVHNPGRRGLGLQRDSARNLTPSTGTRPHTGTRPSLRTESGGEDDDEVEEDSPVFRTEELVRQLKHVVKVQHGRIEELQEKLAFAGFGVRAQLANQEASEVQRLRQEVEDLRQAAYRLKADLASAKKDNETLRSANRRLRGMLQQEGAGGGYPLDVSEPSRGSEQLMPLVSPRGIHLPQALPLSARSTISTRPLAGAAVAAVAESHDSSPSPSEPTTPRMMDTGGGGKTPGNRRSNAVARRPSQQALIRRRSSMGAFPSKLSGLVSWITTFYRDLESPSALLRALLEVSGRVLTGDRPPQQVVSLNVYLAEPWLRSAAATEVELAPSSFGGRGGRPATFYLGQVRPRVELLSFPPGPGGDESTPPRFLDLHSLPLRSRGVLAVALPQAGTTGSSKRVLGVLQATISSDSRPGAEVPKALRRQLAEGGGEEPPGGGGAAAAEAAAGGGGEDVASPLGGGTFSDAEASWLQLLGGVAGSLLTQMERISQKQHICERVKECSDITTAINKASGLRDLEHLLKQNLLRFFGVASVRLLYYQPEGKTLLLSPAQTMRKDCVSVSVERGAVGLCAKRRHLLHIPNLAQVSYLDAVADGLRRNGRPVNPNASMLCGPLVTDQDQGTDGSRLLGVVQLLDRKSGAAGGGGTAAGGGEFSLEEQTLFQQLLAGCTQSLLRVMRLQGAEMRERRGGGEVSLQQMLTAS